jgi:glycosyltransferase involved in cell wall biosynthesis
VTLPVTVSVIIPCYNAEPYLAQTIGSVLAQTPPPNEFVGASDAATLMAI